MAPIDPAAVYLDDLSTYDRLDSPTLFGDDRLLELEVGPGKGLFLTNTARRQPETNYLGIEIARKYARAAAARAAKAGLTNVRVIAGDAKRLLADRVPPASLAAVHVYFPDPWWKKRHKKRRVFTEDFVREVARALRPAGQLHVATDVEDYYTVIRQTMDDAPSFVEEPVEDVREPEHDLDYLTNFERKYRIEGRPIYRARYRRDEGPGPAPPAL